VRTIRTAWLATLASLALTDNVGYGNRYDPQKTRRTSETPSCVHDRDEWSLDPAAKPLIGHPTELVEQQIALLGFERRDWRERPIKIEEARSIVAKRPTPKVDLRHLESCRGQIMQTGLAIEREVRPALSTLRRTLRYIGEEMVDRGLECVVLFVSTEVRLPHGPPTAGL
jgi:hypothetical protein